MSSQITHDPISLSKKAVVALSDDGLVISEWESMAAAGEAIGCSAAQVKMCVRHCGLRTISGARLHLKTGGPYPPRFIEGSTSGRNTAAEATSMITNYEERLEDALNLLSPSARKWSTRQKIINKMLEISPGFVPDVTWVISSLRDLKIKGKLRSNLRPNSAYARSHVNSRARCKLIFSQERKAKKKAAITTSQERMACASTPAGAKTLPNGSAKPSISLAPLPKVSAEQAASIADLELNRLSRARREAFSDLVFFPPTDGGDPQRQHFWRFSLITFFFGYLTCVPSLSLSLSL